METTVITIPHPPIVSRDGWLAARKRHLQHEKELTRHRDRVTAERRRLPMVKLDKDYRFDGPEGERSLRDLFDGRRQLIVYHFMFDPEWDEGCQGCTGYVSSLGDLSMLKQRDTTFVLVSRAPLAKLEAYKALKGWKHPWYSSFGSDFNYDFHVTADERVAPVEYKLPDGGGAGGTDGRAPLPQRRAARSERLLPHRRRRLPHLLGVRAGRGRPHRRLQPARHHALRPAGGLGGFAVRLAPAADVRLAARTFMSGRRATLTGPFGARPGAQLSRLHDRSPDCLP